MTSHCASLVAPVHDTDIENAEASILSDGGFAWIERRGGGSGKTDKSNHGVGYDRSGGSGRRTSLVSLAERTDQKTASNSEAEECQHFRPSRGRGTYDTVSLKIHERVLFKVVFSINSVRGC